MKSVEEFIQEEGISKAELGRLSLISRSLVSKREIAGWWVGWRVVDGERLVGWQNGEELMFRGVKK